MMAQSQSENVRLGEDGESVVLLDQTRLPGRVEYRAVRKLEEMVEAIRALRVRGAPISASLPGSACPPWPARWSGLGWTPRAFERAGRKGKTLVTSRPTAVNLSWAVERMLGRASGLAEALPGAGRRPGGGEPGHPPEDEEMCRAIAEHGLSC